MTPRPVGVVTGGTSGIGQAIACELARRGHDIIVVGRNVDRLRDTLAVLRDVDADGRYVAAPLDVTSDSDMAELAALCDREFGRVDVLIASAGIGMAEGQGRRLPTATKDLPFEEWQAVLAVNLHGVFLCNTALLPRMIAQGGGTIVNIGSSTTPHGLRGQPLAPAYCASKFAMSEFSRQLADEVGEHGIAVSTVFPGSVETPLISDTLLDGPFGGSIAAHSFAGAVCDLIELGEAIELPDPHLLPMPTRPVVTGTRARGARLHRH